MRNRLLLATILAVALSTVASAQDLYIRGGNVLMPDGTVAKDTDVIVRDGVISSIAPASDAHLKASANGIVIDATGKNVVPGFVAGYSQLGTVEIDMVGATNDTAEESGPNTAQIRAEDAYNPLSETIPVTRLGGVTSALVAPGGSNVIVGTSSVFTLNYDTMERALERNAVALHINLGEGPKGKFGEKDSMPSTRMGTAAFLRAEFQRAAEYKDKWDRYRVKYAKFQNARTEFPAKLEKWTNDKTKDRGDEPEEPDVPDAPDTNLQLEPMVAVLGGGTPVAFRAERLDDIGTMLRLCEEFKLRPILIGGADAWKIASTLSDRGVPVVLNACQQPDGMESAGATYENAKLLNAAGVKIAFFTGDTAHNVRNLPFDAAVAVAHGLPREAALAAITKNPAEIWGVEGSLGSIREGLKANILVIDGDPLQPNSKIEHLFIDGTAVPLTSRQTDLAKKYGEKYLNK